MSAVEHFDDWLSRRSFLIVAMLTLQFVWLGFIDGAKLAWINLVPGLVFVPVVVLFAAEAWRHDRIRRVVFLTAVMFLLLRPAAMLSPKWIMLVWLVAGVVVALVGERLYRWFRERGSQVAFALMVSVVFFNGASHLGLSSPFTNTFRMMNDLKSDFRGVDNNATWECAYEVPYFAVHCDARHFVASEKIFTESDYDPSFSVVLSRFFTGYLASLVGIEGLRWMGMLILNFMLWIGACAAIYRLCAISGLSVHVSRAAMLSVASAWGFVSMFAQPAPYLPSFAFGTFATWAVIELLRDGSPEVGKRMLMGFVLVSGVLVYEMYPIALACILVLWLCGRWRDAIAVAIGQIVMSFAWREIGLDGILGTGGDLVSASSGVSNISRNISTWMEVVAQTDVSRMVDLLWVGTQAYAFGNLIYGAVAFVLFLWLGRSMSYEVGARPLWMLIVGVNILVILATFFIVPQMFHWSPTTGMQPRLAFFSLPLNLAAACYLVGSRFPRAVYAIPATLAVLANVDQTGFASIAMMFDYGRLGIYWY